MHADGAKPPLNNPMLKSDTITIAIARRAHPYVIKYSIALCSLSCCGLFPFLKTTWSAVEETMRRCPAFPNVPGDDTSMTVSETSKMPYKKATTAEREFTGNPIPNLIYIERIKKKRVRANALTSNSS